MIIYERSFTTASLPKSGSVVTRMRGSRVIFIGNPPFSAKSKLSKYGRDELLAWIAEALAEGSTVILHPSDSKYESTESIEEE